MTIKTTTAFAAVRCTYHERCEAEAIRDAILEIGTTGSVAVMPVTYPDGGVEYAVSLHDRFGAWIGYAIDDEAAR